MNRARKGRSIGSLALVALLLLDVLPGQACGPFFPQAVFTHKLHPDFPLENYALGDLGIVQKTYARSYLFVAYRYLTGRNLDPEEQAAVVSLWQERLNSAWPDHRQWIKDWQAARKQVSGVGAGPAIRDTFRDFKQRYWYANCLEDTFHSAVAALNERIRRFGTDSEAIREWVAGQDAVLLNCADKETIPAPLSADADPLLRADRAYQIAAAHFYAGHFDIAEKLFRDIAADRGSPWSGIAPYLAIRSLVRRATLTSESEGAERNLLRRAALEIQTLLQDQRSKDIHDAAHRLSAVIRLRAEPAERLNELAREILKKDSAKTLKQDLSDYTWLLDRIQPPVRVSDLTDWILTYQASGAPALDHALARWRETKSSHWLLVLLDKSQAGQAHVEDALAQAATVKPNSPAYLTIAYHRLRLLEEMGRSEQARKLADQLLSEAQSLSSPSALNLLLARRFRLARNLEEFLKYAPRIAALVAFGEDSERANETASPYAGRAYFDQDAADALSRAFPLRMLKDAALKTLLPPELRRDLLLATWVRAVLLGDEQTEREIGPTLQRTAPELREALRSYARAPNADAKKFAAAYLILRHPGLRPYVESGVGRTTALNRIDDYRDNWWCALDEILGTNISLDNVAWRVQTRSPVQGSPARLKAAAPKFLSAEQIRLADAEQARLMKIAAAPSYLGEHVIEWAKKHPADPRSAEALHLTVKATRFGCTDQRSGAISRAAFELLHRRFPQSEWTRKTPYWYDG